MPRLASVGASSAKYPHPICTGGSVSTIGPISGKYYKVHTFTGVGSNTFTVLKAGSASSTIRALAVASGSNGDNGGHGGAGGGVVDTAGLVVPSGSYTCFVGNTGNGGTSYFGGYVTATPGGPGSGAGSAGCGNGGNGSTSDIVNGSAIWYGGGGGAICWNYCCPAAGGSTSLGGGGSCEVYGQIDGWYYGGGGGGTQHTQPRGGYGYQGIVVVRYEYIP